MLFFDKRTDARTENSCRLFWNTHKLFLKYMFIAAKVDQAIQVTNYGWIQKKPHCFHRDTVEFRSWNYNNDFEDGDDIAQY